MMIKTDSDLKKKKLEVPCLLGLQPSAVPFPFSPVLSMILYEYSMSLSSCKRWMTVGAKDKGQKRWGFSLACSRQLKTFFKPEASQKQKDFFNALSFIFIHLLFMSFFLIAHFAWGASRYKHSKVSLIKIFKIIAVVAKLPNRPRQHRQQTQLLSVITAKSSHCFLPRDNASLPKC